MSRNTGQLLYMVLGSAVVLATWAPAFGSTDADGYPFSTYPMFAAKRKAPTFAKAEAKHADGTWAPVPPLLLGSSEVMQAVATVRIAARSKRKASDLCRTILATQNEGYREVRIKKVKYDPIAYFVEGPVPLSQETVAECGPDAEKRERRAANQRADRKTNRKNKKRKKRIK